VRGCEVSGKYLERVRKNISVASVSSVTLKEFFSYKSKHGKIMRTISELRLHGSVH